MTPLEAGYLLIAVIMGILALAYVVDEAEKFFNALKYYAKRRREER